jgi:peptidoglycan/xylan/chitin deacetylase (PgdA/CDA1 family)
MFIRPSTFERRLRWLAQHNFQVVPLDELTSAIRARVELPANSVAITIDDGWYGTYADMLPALERERMPATLYCDTRHLEFGKTIPHVFARYASRLGVVESGGTESGNAFIAATDQSLPLETRLDALEDLLKGSEGAMDEHLRLGTFRYMSIRELKDAHVRGLDVQLHTHSHSLHDFSPERIREEVLGNQRRLSEYLDVETSQLVHFCYPSGVTAPGLDPIFATLGIQSATTLEYGLTGAGSNIYLLPRVLDGDHLSELEFAAHMSGLIPLLKRLVGMVRRAR